MTAATVVLLPAILLGAAVVFDLLQINSHRSYLQGQADMAALEAVRHSYEEDAALEKARRSVANNQKFEASELLSEQVTLGRWENHVFTPKESGDVRRANAAHVVVRSVAQTNAVATLWEGIQAPIARSATAVLRERVSFSLSNCLTSLNLFRGALQPLLGANLDLLCSDGALDLQVDALLETLATDLDAPMTYGEVLDADVSLAQLWSVALGLDVPAPPETIRLGEVIEIDEANRGLEVGAMIPGASVDGSDLVFASLELLSQHMVDLDLRADLGGIANVPLSLTVLEPRRIVTDVEPGSPEAYAETAQIRIGINGLDLLGLVKLDLGLQLAQATAQLSGASSMCSGGDNASALFSPASAALAVLEVELKLLGLSVREEIHLVEAADLAVRFTPDEVRDKTVKQISARLEGSLQNIAREATDLLDQLPLGGLGGLVGGLLGGVTSLLSPLEALLGAIVHDVVGLFIAPANLQVLGASCDVRLVR